jgi:glycogen(starch) synthase
MRVLILSHVELTRDPRARRQAEAAAHAGLDVIGICPADADDPLPFSAGRVVRTRGEHIAPRLRRVGIGGIQPTRDRSVVRELRGLFRLWRLVRTNVLLARAARREGPVDVVLANEIETLPAGWFVARRSHARLVYDAHEIYTSSEPDHPVAHRTLTAWLEGVLARRADDVLTVSDAIAEELERSLRLRRKPLAVLNAPKRTESGPAARLPGPLRVVYQGAMAASRPVEDLLAAAEVAEAASVTIRVANADLAALRAEVQRRGLAGRVQIADPVSPTELVEALAGEDVGVILNRPVSLNDELVFPNKLFEYMMAGLAIVAPRLRGVESFITDEKIGALYEPGNPASLGSVLAELAKDLSKTAAMGARSRELALERYNADVEGERLAAVLTRAPTF